MALPVVAVALLAIGCSDDQSGSSPDGPLQVVSLVLVDASRSTAATPSRPAAPTRTLATDVYLPAGDGPFPLVVLSHGFRSHPSRFAHVLQRLAQAGYVAAAPAYPLTNSSAPEGGDHAEDVFQQPADLAFVIDELLRLSRDADGPLAGRVDPERIGLVGSSLGSITSLGLAYNSCCRDASDERIDAVVSISGLLFPFPGEYEIAPAPLLLIHGDADDTLPYASSGQAFAEATGPKWFVTLVGGGHDVAQLGFDTEGSREHFEEFAAIVIDFLDLYLRGERAAFDRLVDAATIDGLTTLRYDAVPPPSPR